MRLQKFVFRLAMASTLVALTACGPSNPPAAPTLDTTLIHTQAAQTVAVQLTASSAAQTAAAPPPTATATPTLPLPSTLTPVPGGLPLSTPLPINPLFPTATNALLPGVLPSPTGVPCNDSLFIMQFGAQDGTVFRPGQAFGVGWRIQNVGVCNWVPGYALVQTGGNSNFGGDTFVIRTPQEAVASGAIVDISLNLVAPKQPGVYEAWYQMFSDKSVPFGTGMSIRIEVRK